MDNKLFIFDFDGVLVDSKKIHFDSLNAALSEIDLRYVISEIEQSQVYEGLPTKSKLDILNKTKNLPKDFFDQVWRSKQKYSDAMLSRIDIDEDLISMIKFLKSSGFYVAVASNSIRTTLDLGLKRLGIIDLIDYSLSNEDVINPKPDSEIYIKCINHFGVDKKNVIIFEDSPTGLKSAIDSEAKTIFIKNRSKLTMNKILNAINLLNETNKINILIPMAGKGNRFLEKGYSKPKPLVQVKDKTMIESVVENLSIDGQYIFIVQKEHCDKYDLDSILESIAPDSIIIPIDWYTNGTAITTLIAKAFINDSNKLIIANSDQLVDWNSKHFADMLDKDGCSGSILLFNDNNPKWSYAKINNDLITEVAEKVVISENATVGIYGWTNGSDYVKYVEQMIKKDIRTNDEFYVCPVYNEAIQDGKKIAPFFVGRMIGLGTPEDLEYYLNENNIS